MTSKTKDDNVVELAALGKQAKVVFHDLANHLTALTLSINHLENRFIEDSARLSEYKRHSEKTREQMESVAALLRSHIDNSHAVYFNMSKEIENITRTFDDRAHFLGVKIEIDLQKNLHLHGNRSAFVHVVTNLISNALESFDNLKAARKKIIHIRLESEKEVVLSISDTGCGIARKNRDKIFTQGFTTKQMGHGIGLSATKEYTEKVFNGTISLKTSSKGTTFTIAFPKPSNSY